MKALIEKLLKEKIGTSFVHVTHKGIEGFVLRGYGRDIIVLYDIEINGFKSVRIIFPRVDTFATDIKQEQPNFETYFVETLKMMIELLKKQDKK